MAFLTITELQSHLFGEVLNEISRGNDDITQSAIDAAIEEVKGYLSAYDVAAIFSAVDINRNPILLLYTKDVAVWHLIQLSNPNVEMQLRLDRYEKAIKWLDKVQSGKVVPNLPYPAAVAYAEPNQYIKWGSNPRRNLSY